MLRSLLSLTLFFQSILSLNTLELSQSASVYYNKDLNEYQIILNTLDTSSVAYATYKPKLSTKGWDFLTVTTNQNNKYDDKILAYGAGYLEGYLTRKRILDHFKNMSVKTWGEMNKMPSNIRSFFIENKNYILTQYSLNSDDNYWKMIHTLYMQFEGIVQAYNDSVDLYKIDFVDFHTIASMGDLFDIVYYKKPPNFNKMDYSEIVNLIQKNSHCSALIKLSSNKKKLWFGHNTWFYYAAMTRIFKEYNFKFKNPIQKTNRVMFSSYPGTIASLDDFYITNNDIIAMETTNMFFNSRLYEKYLTPKSLLSWLRSMTANFASDSSKEWIDYFVKANSGTYNNQYMVMDMKKIKKDSEGRLKLNNNTLWIVEQIPGYTKSKDVTQTLREGYWPSYNIPYFNEIRKRSLINYIIKKDKRLEDFLSYNSSPRALLFKRDQQKITSFTEFKNYMRYNDYRNDPLSKGNPTFAISSRGDLNESKDTICVGTYDVKAGSFSKIRKERRKSVNIIGSPSNLKQPSFNWDSSKVCKNEPRNGLADNYNFDWMEYIMDTSNYE